MVPLLLGFILVTAVINPKGTKGYSNVGGNNR